MNAIDGTDRNVAVSTGPPPSLLVIVFDTNPFAWDLLEGTLSIKEAVANLLVFINAHLAISHANRVAVIASHCDKATWLYPTPTPALSLATRRTETSRLNGAKDGEAARGPVSANANANARANGTSQSDVKHGSAATDDVEGPAQRNQAPTNKYRPFEVVERELMTNLVSLLSRTTTSLAPNGDTADHATATAAGGDGGGGGSTTSLVAGALTTALAYISKTSLLLQPVLDTTLGDEPTAPIVDANDGTLVSRRAVLTARILVVSVSGDLASQYIPVMNAVFAAQRHRVPIDILKLAGDTVFLQQASDATGGVYMAPKSPQGLLQYLMMAFLPDPTCRQWLVPSTEAEVDFRAACFCHRDVVRIAYVCSVCLSIFCSALEGDTCLTCGTYLASPANQKPAQSTTQRKKKH